MHGKQRGSAAMLVIGLIALIILALGAWQYMNGNPTPAVDELDDVRIEAQSGAVAASQGSTPVMLEGGVLIQDMKVGTGEEAKVGQRLSLHYTGTLDDGTVFDSSVARNDPFEFTLGAGEVIPGWDIGIGGMKVGGERKLTIPPAMGYGAQAVGPIPANSTLHFEVVLLGIKQ